jgi:hypothetical protein
VVPVTCASYTHARRHPKVLGKIGGWAPPVQLSFTQLATFAAVAVALVMSWELWAAWLPPLGPLVVITAAPSAAAWAVRRSRVEGRSLVRTAAGFITLVCQPRTGTLAGRPAPSGGRHDWRAHRAFVVHSADEGTVS